MTTWLVKPTTDYYHCLVCSKYDYNGHNVDREKIKTQSEATRYWPCFYLNIDQAALRKMYKAPLVLNLRYSVRSVSLCYLKTLTLVG